MKNDIGRLIDVEVFRCHVEHQGVSELDTPLVEIEKVWNNLNFEKE